MSKRSNNFALGAILAAGLGYLAGILTAPKSGKETRKDFQRSANKAKKEAEKKLKSLHSDLDGLIAEGKSKAKDTTTKAKAELNKNLAKAQTAKEKARKVLSALHEGDSEDEDLKLAINQAKEARENLKKYLAKNAKEAKK